MFGLKTPSTHKFLRDRIIFIGLPIDDQVASDVLDALGRLEKKASSPITIYINSPGGLAFAGKRIVRRLDDSPAEIRTHCLGLAAGVPAGIFFAGRRRFATPTARVQFTGFRAGDRTDTAEIEDLRRRFIAHASQSLDLTVELIAQWVAEEACFSGALLVEHRIAHQIV
jgi:ATP-dependent Clp protease protease subunit